MLTKDLKNHLTVTESLVPARRTATGNGASLDLQNYEGDILAVMSSALGGGTTPTLDVKIQDSADDSTFADVTGKTFTQVTGAAGNGVQEMTLDPRALRRYIRMVATIAGTSPTFDCYGQFIGQKKTQ